MKKKGKDLDFISEIGTNGKIIKDISMADMSYYDQDIFILNTLSVPQKTYIASAFNSYVVKFKKVTKQRGKH